MGYQKIMGFRYPWDLGSAPMIWSGHSDVQDGDSWSRLMGHGVPEDYGIPGSMGSDMGYRKIMGSGTPGIWDPPLRSAWDTRGLWDPESPGIWPGMMG